MSEGELSVEKKLCRNSEVEMNHILLPNQVDMHGIAYGGTIMSWIDVCAGMSAYKHSGHFCVTASIDAIHFLHPVRLGDIVVVKSKVTRTWNTSMEILVYVMSESMGKNVKKRYNFCCSAFLIFVALQQVGLSTKPVKIPVVIPESGIELNLFDEAQVRRERRQEMRRNCENCEPNMNEGRLCGSFCENNDIVMPQNANPLGRTFGGHILKLMELSAAISASRHVFRVTDDDSGVTYRTVSMDSINFIKPTSVGDIITVQSFVTKTFSSSLEVYIKVFDKNGNLTNDGYLTMVAVDSELPNRWKEHPIGDADVNTIDKTRYLTSKDRREKRLLVT
jgi:acyl-CoA hydrolase